MKKEFEKRIQSSLILIPTAFFFLVKGFILFLFLMGIFFTIAVYEWLKIAKYNSIKLFGFLFLLFSFYTAFLLRTEIGLGTFLLIIIICIFTDIGGYISGKTFKGPKLTKISPNKTYSGMFSHKNRLWLSKQGRFRGQPRLSIRYRRGLPGERESRLGFAGMAAT